MSTDLFIQYEAWIKLGAFLSLFLIIASLEAALPRRNILNKWKRWLNNLGMIAVSSLLLRLLIPIAASTFALWLMQKGFGLLNVFTLPIWLEALIAIIVLDLAIYWQHRAFHYWPLLWRAHRVHHSDTEFDVSLGIRFHALEILPSMLYKFLIIALLGASPIAVMLYEILLLSFSLFTHGNIAIPKPLDGIIRSLFVTPEFHRVHHSVYREETDSNYGNIFSIWDHVFKTYRPKTQEEQKTMQIGLAEFRAQKDQALIPLLLQPFRNTMTKADTEHA